MAPILAWLGKAIAGAVVTKQIERVTEGNSVSSGITEVLTSDSDVQRAREMQSAPSHNTWLDVVIDGAARLPRPLVFFWVLGILFGFWDGPDFEKIDDKVETWIEYIMGFLFGHRAMARDMPAMIGGITKALRK